MWFGKMTNKILNKIPEDVLAEVLYSEESPTGLVFAVDVFAGYEYRALCKRKGDVAGSVSTSSVYSCFRGYPSHRIIWTLHYGEIPDGKILDHIDGNTRNNRIENLRLSNTKFNAQNQKKYSTNKSGKTGVYFNKYPEPYGRWCAHWKINGRILQKSFNINKYGDRAFQLACEYRDKMIKFLNETQGCDYTTRHGE